MIGRFFLDLYNPNCNNMNFDYSRDVCENGGTISLLFSDKAYGTNKLKGKEERKSHILRHKKRHSQECLPLAAESAAPTASANDD